MSAWRKLGVVVLALAAANAWSHLGLSRPGLLVRMTLGWVVGGYLLWCAWPRVCSDFRRFGQAVPVGRLSSARHAGRRAGSGDVL